MALRIPEASLEMDERNRFGVGVFSRGGRRSNFRVAVPKKRANWNDPPAHFALAGRFALGSHGTTLLPRHEPLNWRIGDVRPGESLVLEMQLERSTLSLWCFDICLRTGQIDTTRCVIG
jgi:hypothetical protein